jgi:hypothetical protein
MSRDLWGFKAHFTVELWEPGPDGDERVALIRSPNRVLRAGLFAMVTQGIYPSQFDHFVIGTGEAAESAALPGLVAPLPDSIRAGTPLELPFPQWGFTTTYQPGEATGNWTEIGMRFGPSGPTINRSRFIDGAHNYIVVPKYVNRRATVSVVFTMFRA